MLALLLGTLEDPADRRLLAALYEQHHTAMLCAAYALLGDARDAEDAVQSAFLAVIRHFDSLLAVPADRRRFWLIAVTQNEARLLRRKRRGALPLEEERLPAAEGAAGRTELADLIRRLPDTYRGALEMKYLLDCPDAEIARRLGISEGAVATRLSRARALLRDLLEKEGMSV